MRFLLIILLFVLVLSGCPNQCSGHGTCKGDGVCECSKGTISGSGSVNNYLYYGADCSYKTCPLGPTFSSFAAVALPDATDKTNNGGRLLKSVNTTRCENVNECVNVGSLLTNSSSSRNLAATVTGASVDGYYTVTGIDFPLLKNNKGELVCKNELGDYIGKIKVIGKKEGKYTMKIPGEDATNIFIKYNCYETFSYNDLSLINPVISEENKITWKGMKEILGDVKTDSVNFACKDVDTNALKVYTTDPAGGGGGRILADNNDIVFTFNALPAGLWCYYLGEATVDGGTSDASKVSSLLLTDGIDIGLNGKKMYEIYNFNPKPTTKYALLNCYNKYTNDLVGKTYLMDYTGSVAKVVFDFDGDIIYDPYDLKCEIIEEYKEVTSLYPMTIENIDTAGKFTNAYVDKVIALTDTLILGCYTPNTYEFKTYSYTYTAAGGTFEVRTSDSARRNLAEATFPAKGDICYIPVKSDDLKNAASFVSKHLILNGAEDKYKYFDENSIVYLPGTSVVNNIYILENITFNIGTSGALVECTNTKNNNNVIEIQILEKIENVDIKLNKYYVKYNNNKIGSGEYKCELIHQTNDLSLFELTKSTECNIANSKAKCDLTMTSMSNFLTKLPGDKKLDVSQNYDVKIACSRGDSIEIYNYQYTAPADVSGRLLDDELKSDNVVFSIKEDSPIVPSTNDICHIISYTSKSSRRVRRLEDPDADYTALKDSDYGKSLSNYIYKPSESIEVDIGRMNHKIYEVNNINIIPEGIDNYIGSITCKYSNNEGNGYLMGKSNNGYMILFDFINENTVPLINSYDCKLNYNYNDLSLLYSSTIKSQISNGIGECYTGKCDLIMKGMNKLLGKVTLAEGKEGKNTLTALTSANPMKFACMNKVKKVTIYDYERNEPQANDYDLTFSISTSSKAYPLIGHVCNILSDLDGAVKYDSEYIINPPTGAKLPATLMSTTAVVENSIYKVRRFSPTPSSIGYSICTTDGSDTIIAYNYGKITSEKSIDSYYIRYVKDGKDIISPTPELYSCKSFTPIKDTSSLIKATVPAQCDSSDNCPLELAKGYKEILENMGYNTENKVSFACYSKDDKLTSYKYTYKDQSDLIFDYADDNSVYPKEKSECSLLLDLEGKAIENIKESELIILSSTAAITYNSQSIWKVTNINYKLGINKCYNKYTSDYVGDGIFYGKEKDSDYINLVSYTDKEGKDYTSNTNLTPESYNCKSYKSYNDLSLLLPSDDNYSPKCENDKCYYQYTGIKPLLTSYGIDTSGDVELNVGCEVESEMKELIFTTKSDDANNVPNPTPTPTPGDITTLILYIKKDQNVDYTKMKRCYILLKSDGSKLSLKDSDINKLPLLSSTEVIDNSGIYYAYNLGFSYKTGLMKCYDTTGSYKGDLIIYQKNKETYKVKLGNGLVSADFYKYTCQEASEFNDLSLFNPTVSEENKITWIGVKTILDSLGFKIDNIKEGKVKFVCIKNDDKTVSYVETSAVAYGSGDSENLEFTVTITEASTCYLLSHLDGSIITEKADIKNSDVGKKFGLTGETTQTSLPIVEETITSRIGNVYKVSNVEYDIKDNEVIITDCFDKTKGTHLGESYVLSKTGNDYYISYLWIANTDTPTPADYECSKSGSYSDLSLLVEVTIEKVCTAHTDQSSNAECDITIEGLKDVYSSFTSPSDKTYQFICSNSKKELHLYNYTITTATVTADSVKVEVTFTIDSKSDVVPYYGDKCNLLANTSAIPVLLSESEYGKKNGILTDNVNGEELTTEKKVETVESESIPDAIPKSGGILKCYDKESGEYVGTIEVIGKKSNGEAIIKYNIENSKLGINEDELSIDLFDTTIDSVNNDLSLTNPPIVPSTCETNPNNCKLRWSEVGEILLNPSESRRIRELDIREVNLVCPNGKEGNVLTEITFQYDDSDESKDIILTPKSIPKDFSFISGSSCYVLIDGDGKTITKENSELFKNKVTIVDGDAKLITDIKINGVSGVISSVDISIDVSKSLNTWKEQHALYIELGDNKEERDMNNKLTLGSIFKIGNEYVTLLGIKRNVPQSPTRRLLFENERELQSSNGIALQISNGADTTINKAISSKNNIHLRLVTTGGVNAHNLLECSGVGTCDRESGVCSCYNGFTGAACERMSCPNDCNNHGKCVSNKELISTLGNYNGFGNDGKNEMIFGCLCDSGYRGVDCSLKECPSDNSVDRDCSNHGLCDYSDGSCKCFDGYYGEGCQHSITS